MGWSALQARNFLSLEHTSRNELKEILDLARTHAVGHAARTLVGRTVCLAFFEASTRTAVSFELAARRAGAARLAARHTNAAIVNAGDGCGQHPTQALLDLYALSSSLSGFDELAGRKIAVVGDVLHSRVARSVIPG